MRRRGEYSEEQWERDQEKLPGGPGDPALDDDDEGEGHLTPSERALAEQLEDAEDREAARQAEIERGWDL